MASQPATVTMAGLDVDSRKVAAPVVANLKLPPLGISPPSDGKKCQFRSIYGEFRVPPSVLTLSEMFTAEPETYGTRGSTVPSYPSSFYILVRRREVSTPSAVYSLALSSGWWSLQVRLL
jgi:hypothetical protein